MNTALSVPTGTRTLPYLYLQVHEHCPICTYRYMIITGCTVPVPEYHARCRYGVAYRSCCRLVCVTETCGLQEPLWCHISSLISRLRISSLLNLTGLRDNAELICPSVALIEFCLFNGLLAHRSSVLHDLVVEGGGN